MEYLEALWDGMKRGWRHNCLLIHESKWYIIPVAINVLLAPLLIPSLIIGSMVNEKFARRLLSRHEEIKEELGED